MPDLLSLSSGIAGLLSLTIEITRVSYEYISGVKDAPKSVLALISEVTSLENVLRDLRNKIVLNPEVAGLLESAQLNSTVRDQVLQQCEVDLRAFLEELRGKSGANTVTTSWHRVKWPFKDTEMQKKIERLRFYQSQLTTLATNDTLAVTSLTYKEVKDWRSEESSQKALDWLSPLDFDAKHRDMLSRWHQGTCQWILDSPAFGQWSEEDIEAPQKRVLWCSGAPCVGKTIATSLVIDQLTKEAQLRNYGVAYVYCSYGDQVSQTPTTLLGSLAKQLAGECSSFPTLLGSFFAARQKKPPTVDVCLDVINHVSRPFSKTFLIFDALDEIENSPRKNRTELLELITSLTRVSDNVRILVTSRPHLSDIRKAFEEANMLNVVAREDDVQGFLRYQIESNADLQDIIEDNELLKERIVASILRNSGSQFLLPSLHVTRLNDLTCKEDIEDVLEDLTNSVDETYSQTFDRLKDKSKPRQELVNNVLLWLSYAKRPLKFEELQEAIALKWKESELEIKSLVPRKIILEACLGLVSIESQSGTITLVHYTLEEYFKARHRSRVDPNAFIGMLLLSYLSRRIITDAPAARYDVFPRTLLQDCPLLPYAFHFWHDHAKSSQDLFETAILTYFSIRPKTLPIPSDALSRSLSTALLKRNPPLPLIWQDLFYAVVLHLDHIVRRLVQRGANPFAYYADLGCPSILTWMALAYMDIIYRKELAENVCSLIVKAMFQDNITLAKANHHDLVHMTTIFPLLSEEIMALVLERGFDVTCMYSFSRPVEYWMIGQDGRGEPLHMAAFYKSPVAIRVLIQHGANPNSKAYEGVTALDIALASRYPASEDRLLDTVSALLSGGAQPILRHQTALEAAKKHNLESLLTAHEEAKDKDTLSAPLLEQATVLPQDHPSSSIEDAFTNAVFQPGGQDQDMATEIYPAAEDNALYSRRAKSHVRRRQYESTSSKQRQDSFRKSSTDALTTSIVFDQVMEIDEPGA